LLKQFIDRLLNLGAALTTQQIWAAYSPTWQRYNTLRTVVSGVALLLAGFGIYQIGVGNEPTKR